MQRCPDDRPRTPIYAKDPAGTSIELILWFVRFAPSELLHSLTVMRRRYGVDHGDISAAR